MEINEIFVNYIREALQQIPDVEEKKMFSGLTFMVNGKMCISVRKDSIMCRINPASQQIALKKKGAEIMIMKGREYTKKD